MENILYIIAFSFFLIAPVYLVKRVFKTVNNFGALNESYGDIVFESLFIYILPGIGIVLTANKCDEHPFDLAGLTTTYTVWILFSLAHFLSKYQKRNLSPIALLIVTSLMIMGFIFCLAICTHFLSHGYFALIPLFQLIYLSPLFCLLFLLRELSNLSNYLKAVFERMNSKNENSLHSFYKWLEKYHLGFALYILAPVLVIVQALLYLIGQKPDSLISQFTDSCGYVLSYQQFCSCGGDHYLCSIAANGSKALVKPVRMGVRQNKKILVNRQLLIANAFENWLEEYTPYFHKRLRKAYDDCKIPVNAWSKHKCFANVLYVVMKPLEWFFLAWLYL